MLTLVDQRAALVKEMQGFKGKAEAGTLTAKEFERLKSLGGQVGELDAQLKRADEVSAFLSNVSPVFDSGEVRASAARGMKYVDRSPAGVAQVADKIIGAMRSKSLLATGTEPIAQPFLDEAVTLPHTPANVSDLFKRDVITGSVYQYLRQESRDNQATVVPVGSKKPTSLYEFRSVKGELHVLAHLSEPMHEYWLNDFPQLTKAVVDELLWGIADAESNLILNGSGVGEPTGILNTSGIQTQAFVTDALATTRAAITKLELLGYVPDAFVMHPVDWAAIELSRDASGRFEFSTGPVNAAEKLLWSTRVATTHYMPQGTALVIAPESAHVITNASINVAATTTSGDDFEYNRIRIRAEERIGVAVTKPMGIVKISLSAA